MVPWQVGSARFIKWRRETEKRILFGSNMLTYIVGDLFRSPARVLVNTVNTVGVMGKGIAKDFKAIYPEMFAEYQKLCEGGNFEPGKLHLYRTERKWILNFPTKKHWRQPSRVEYIEGGLRAFVEGYSRNSITSIAFPQLGCGNGELNWESQVKPLMEKYLADLPIEVFIHLYDRHEFPSEHRDIKATKAWLRSEPESLSFGEVWEDLVRFIGLGGELTPPGGETFKARVTSEPELGLILGNGSEFFVPQCALLDAWQFLRSVGFMSKECLTYGMDQHSEQIFALFSRLPYLRLAKAAKKRPSSPEEFEYGLQFVPRPIQQQELPLTFPHTVRV